MKLICIRHTSVAVPKGICYGQSDVGLAESYPVERMKISNQLPEHSIDRIFCSPLSRCQTLAKDLFPEYEIVLDDRLKELNFGQWEMQTWDSISQTEEAKSWFNDFVAVTCPGGESFNDQINRTADFLDELKQLNFTSVVVVAHGGILRSIHCLIKGTTPLDAFKSKVDYGEIVLFDL